MLFFPIVGHVMSPPPLRSILLVAYDAITMLYFNPYICERIGLFEPEARGEHVQRLFQSAGIPGAFALLLPEPSLPVLLVRLLVSNLPPAYNHYIKPLGGVRPALVPLVGQVAVGIALPLLATHWLVKYPARGRGKSKKEVEMGVAASATEGASPSSAASAQEYASLVCRRATSSVKARHLGVLHSLLGCWSPSCDGAVPFLAQVKGIEPEDLSVADRDHLLVWFSKSSSPQDHVTLQLLRRAAGSGGRATFILFLADVCGLLQGVCLGDWLLPDPDAGRHGRGGRGPHGPAPGADRPPGAQGKGPLLCPGCAPGPR